MEGLPREVVLQILSRLPLISLLQSKLVCRAWRNLIKDPILIRKHFSNMAKLSDNGCPGFILQSNWPMPDHLCFVDFSAHTELGRVPISMKLPKFSMCTHLVDSCNGLLCIHNASRSVYICNPFTRRYIELPILIKYPALVGQLWFGFSPISKQYKVIRIVCRTRPSSLSTSQSDVQILTINESPAWRSLGMIPYGRTWQTSKVLVNGRLHWLYQDDKHIIVSFDLEAEHFEEVAKPDCCGLDKCFHQLTVIRGCVSAGAYHGDRVLEIWIMKKYGIKESWTKKFNIATYLPRAVNQDHNAPLSFNYSRLHPKSFVRVVCMLRSGEILLEYKNVALVVYDSELGTFKELTIPGMPHWLRLRMIVHVGSLNWLDTPLC